MIMTTSKMRIVKNKTLRTGVLFAFCLLGLFACSSSQIIKQNNVDSYEVKGYLSSRKDHASFDMLVKGNLSLNQYSIKGYDTLLKKERFFLFYENKNWFLKDLEKPGKYYLINPKENFAEILPPPAIFDYIAFFQGKIPTLTNAKVNKTDKKWILEKNDFKQIIVFEKKGFIKEMLFYKNGKKVYKMIYKNYISTQNNAMVFPKTLNILDYQKRRKIIWWMSKINTKEKK